ncbi:SRPBCC family protein [Streptomyces sp. NPDC003470]
MAPQHAHFAQHTTPVAAPAHVVYGLLADAPNWPLLLPGYLHVERMDLAAAPGEATEEHLRTWHLHTGHVRSTRTRRLLRPADRAIDFEQSDTLLPGAPLRGTWTVRPQGPARCLLGLTHDPPAGTPAPDTRAEVDQVAAAAERWENLDELLLSFEDSTRIHGPAEAVYDFLHRIQDWPELLPHVEHADVREDQPGIQFATLDTCATRTGTTLTTGLVRLCFPHAARIVYRHTTVPAPVAAHSGEWYLEPEADGVRAVSAHRVMLRAEAAAALGPHAQLTDARRHVRAWLGRTGTETLNLARWHAENAVRRLR